MNDTAGEDMGWVGNTQLHFGWLDYSLFAAMLAVSALIGLYFGCFGDKQKETVDYLLGGKKMAIFPVAVSQVASTISGVTLMGVPTEVYTNGMLYWLVCIAFIIAGTIINFVYLPVFYKLQLTSTYEYLELRFNKSTRLMASILYTFSMLMYIPIVIYIPALAMNQVSGLSIHLISPLVCVICIFYTMLGGLKAVVWTDFVQAFMIVGAGIIVIVLGVINVGGLQVLWQRNLDAERLEFSKWDPSPLNRDSIWTVIIGFTFVWMALAGTSQDTVQKYLSMPDLTSARRSLLIFVVGLILMNTMSCFTGLVMFATYFKCDPLTTGEVKRTDQLLPSFVMETAANTPGLSGVFIAGIFSGALSTMSTCLNSLSATIYEDFIRPCIRGGRLETKTNIIMRGIVIAAGVVCVLMVFLVEQLGQVFELAYSVGSITSGALLGLFSLGMFFPWANVKGAMVGTISSMLAVGFIVFGAQNAMLTGALTQTTLPVSVEGCHFNQTFQIANATTTPAGPPTEEAFVLYRIAFQYLNAIGALWVVVVGLVVSFLTGARDPGEMNRDLFVTFAHRYVTFNKERGALPIERELVKILGEKHAKDF